MKTFGFFFACLCLVVAAGHLFCKDWTGCAAFTALGMANLNNVRLVEGEG